MPHIDQKHKTEHSPYPSHTLAVGKIVFQVQRSSEYWHTLDRFGVRWINRVAYQTAVVDGQPIHVFTLWRWQLRVLWLVPKKDLDVDNVTQA